MIDRLNQSSDLIAQQMFKVFQRSYKIEAQIIGVSRFPPLERRVKDIQDSNTVFYGFYQQNCLVAIVEIELNEGCLEINSLVVDPEYFGQGIASKLLDYIIDQIDCVKLIVETAVANLPAIKLYQKHGFVEFKRFTPSHGIEKLALSRQCG